MISLFSIANSVRFLLTGSQERLLSSAAIVFSETPGHISDKRRHDLSLNIGYSRFSTSRARSMDFASASGTGPAIIRIMVSP